MTINNTSEAAKAVVRRNTEEVQGECTHSWRLRGSARSHGWGVRSSFALIAKRLALRSQLHLHGFLLEALKRTK
jgi:hypothetical protein